MEPMKKIAATALIGLAMASSPTRAADLFGTAPALSIPESASPTAEVGSNWYLRGDIGVGWNDSPTVVPSAGLIPPIQFDPGTGAAYTNAPIGDAGNDVSVTRGFNQNSQSAQFDLGFGYRVNDYLRVDATWSFWRGSALAYSQKSLCPATTTAVSNTITSPTPPVTTTINGVSTTTTTTATTTTTTPVGYLWEPVGCNGYLNATQYNNMALASAYVDLGNYWGITPYVGAGVGLNANTISGNTRFFNPNDGTAFLGNTTATGTAPLQWVTQTGVNANGAVYTPLTRQPQVVFGTQNWNRNFSATKYSAAGALMAGFGYQISPSATVDIGYRYVSADLFGSTKNTSQQVHIGIRYMAD
jgi:opacity protein-like surface antigen